MLRSFRSSSNHGSAFISQKITISRRCSQLQNVSKYNNGTRKRQKMRANLLTKPCAFLSRKFNRDSGPFPLFHHTSNFISGIAKNFHNFRYRFFVHIQNVATAALANQQKRKYDFMYMKKNSVPLIFSFPKFFLNFLQHPLSSSSSVVSSIVCKN